MTRRQQKQLIGLGISLIALGVTTLQQKGWIKPAVQLAQKHQPGLYQVVKFDDGDTIQVNMGGHNETVRFIGVDTPETHDPRKAVQCFGQAASIFTKQLIGQKDVRLEADPQNTNRDRYNRLLRYVYLPDDRLVNAEIIKQGYGFAYTYFPFSKLDEFRSYEKQAREQQKGLWNSCQVITESNGQIHTEDASK
jgi:endonuclease YncB( thermonuclease family)